jgi:hypothetical protein
VLQEPSTPPAPSPEDQPRSVALGNHALQAAPPARSGPTGAPSALHIHAGRDPLTVHRELFGRSAPGAHPAMEWHSALQLVRSLCAGRRHPGTAIEFLCCRSMCLATQTREQAGEDAATSSPAHQALDLNYDSPPPPRQGGALTGGVVVMDISSLFFIGGHFFFPVWFKVAYYTSFYQPNRCKKQQ